MQIWRQLFELIEVYYIFPAQIALPQPIRPSHNITGLTGYTIQGMGGGGEVNYYF
jgi:hypothetical protein